MQFWLPIVSVPWVLAPGSCEAERLAARVRLHGGPRLTMSPEEIDAARLAYARQREEWAGLVENMNRHRAKTALEGRTGELPLFGA